MMQVTKTPTYKAVQFFGVIATTVLIASCATITNDPNQQIEFVAPGCKDVVVSCTAQNKRGIWTFDAPAVVPIRRSDDNLSVTCKDPDGNESVQSIPSEIGARSLLQPFSWISALSTLSLTNTGNILFKFFSPLANKVEASFDASSGEKSGSSTLVIPVGSG